MPVPNSLPYVQELNSHLSADAAQFNVAIADVLTAFGGATTPNPNICAYTWMCSTFQDIHATTTGYGVIAGAFETLTGYWRLCWQTGRQCYSSLRFGRACAASHASARCRSSGVVILRFEGEPSTTRT